MRPRLLVLAAAGLALAACTMIPPYERPQAPVPADWSGPAVEPTPAPSSLPASEVPWSEALTDRRLRSVVELALANNRDLRIAALNVDRVRSLYQIQRSELYPAVGAMASGDVYRLPASMSESGRSKTVEQYSVQLGTLSWELDFFGRIRRANEAELANLLATEEARRAVAIAVVANVARAYVELRDLDWRLEITRRTLESRREYLGLARDRFEGGLTPELDSRQAEAEMYRVQSYVFQLEGLVAQKENEISYLLGRNPSAVPRGRAVGAQPIPPEVPAGLPAALLERRPDVRQAEEQLISANARIGEARAMLYPQIALTGTYGFASTDLSELLDGSSESWNIFAGLLQPIFQGGKNRRRVEVRESQHRQAVYAYERTVLQALREVEDALIGLQKAGEQRGSQAERVVAERKVLELSELRYRGGVTDYLEVLDAQRSLFNAEIDEVSSISAHVGSLIQLYKALGGGWPVGATAAEQDQNSMSEKGSSG